MTVTNIGVLHPLLLMSSKEVRRAKRLFEMQDEHLSKPLIKCKEGDITRINKVFDCNAYESFLATSNQLNLKLREMADTILEREIGLRAGIIVKITTAKSYFVVVKISSLRLNHSTPLSSSPHQWEWRVYGELFCRGQNKTPMMGEYSLKGNVSLERQVLNGIWLPMVSDKSIEHTEKILAHG